MNSNDKKLPSIGAGSKFKVADRVVFLATSYNKNNVFTVTNVFITFLDATNDNKAYSYRIVEGPSSLDIVAGAPVLKVTNGIGVYWKREGDLYLISAGTLDRDQTEELAKKQPKSTTQSVRS